MAANTQNLIPNEERTPEERRNNARKAGIASGEARRKRKTIRAELEALLAKHPLNDKGEESEMSYQSAMIAALVKKALKGDTKAFEIIRDTIGEKPAENLVVTTADPDIIKEVEAMVYDTT